MVGPFNKNSKEKTANDMNLCDVNTSCKPQCRTVGIQKRTKSYRKLLMKKASPKTEGEDVKPNFTSSPSSPSGPIPLKSSSSSSAIEPEGEGSASYKKISVLFRAANKMDDNESVSEIQCYHHFCCYNPNVPYCAHVCMQSECSNCIPTRHTQCPTQTKQNCCPKRVCNNGTQTGKRCHIHTYECQHNFKRDNGEQVKNRNSFSRFKTNSFPGAYKVSKTSTTSKLQDKKSFSSYSWQCDTGSLENTESRTDEKSRVNEEFVQALLCEEMKENLIMTHPGCDVKININEKSSENECNEDIKENEKYTDKNLLDQLLERERLAKAQRCEEIKERQRLAEYQKKMKEKEQLAEAEDLAKIKEKESSTLAGRCENVVKNVKISRDDEMLKNINRSADSGISRSPNSSNLRKPENTLDENYIRTKEYVQFLLKKYEICCKEKKLDRSLRDLRKSYSKDDKSILESCCNSFKNHLEVKSDSSPTTSSSFWESFDHNKQDYLEYVDRTCDSLMKDIETRNNKQRSFIKKHMYADKRNENNLGVRKKMERSRNYKKKQINTPSSKDKVSTNYKYWTQIVEDTDDSLRNEKASKHLLRKQKAQQYFQEQFAKEVIARDALSDESQPSIQVCKTSDCDNCYNDQSVGKRQKAQRKANNIELTKSQMQPSKEYQAPKCVRRQDQGQISYTSTTTDESASKQRTCKKDSKNKTSRNVNSKVCVKKVRFEIVKQACVNIPPGLPSDKNCNSIDSSAIITCTQVPSSPQSLDFCMNAKNLDDSRSQNDSREDAGDEVLDAKESQTFCESVAKSLSEHILEKSNTLKDPCFDDPNETEKVRNIIKDLECKCKGSEVFDVSLKPTINITQTPRGDLTSTASQTPRNIPPGPEESETSITLPKEPTLSRIQMQPSSSVTGSFWRRISNSLFGKSQTRNIPGNLYERSNSGNVYGQEKPNNSYESPVLLVENLEEDIVEFPNGDKVPIFHGCRCMIGQYIFILTLVLHVDPNNLDCLAKYLINKFDMH